MKNESTSSALPVYRPSGRIGGRAWVTFGLVGVPSALLLGWGYANLLALSRARAWDVVAALVMWLGLAVLVAAVAQRARSRSVRFNRWAGALLGLVVLWAHWVVTFKIVGRPDLAADFGTSGPLGWGRILAALAWQGSDGSIGSWLSTVGVWGLEALITVLVARGMCAEMASRPFSEGRLAWADSVFKGELFAPGAESGRLPQWLARRGVAALLDMAPAAGLAGDGIASQWWTVEVEGRAVEGDPTARWLDVHMLVHSRDAGGKVKVSRQQIVAAWHIGPDEFQGLQELFAGAAMSPQVSEGGPAVVTNPAMRPSTMTSEPQTPVELEPAVAALQAENHALAAALAEGLIQHPEPAVRADALRLCALAHARMSQWGRAFDLFHRLFESEPTAFVALQMATTSVCAGQLLRGQAWLERAHGINRETREMQPPRLDTAYLSALEEAGEMEAAMPLLDKLAMAYRALPTVDDHFVWSHGLPFFGEFLRKSLPLLRASLGDTGVRDWYLRMQADLDDQGRARLTEHLHAFEASR